MNNDNNKEYTYLLALYDDQYIVDIHMSKWERITMTKDTLWE